jgi:hypothetical protein
LVGSQGDLLRFFKYKKEDLKKLLSSNLKAFSKEERMVKFNFISTPGLNSELDMVAKAQSLSRSELVRLIIREWAHKKESEVASHVS